MSCGSFRAVPDGDLLSAAFAFPDFAYAQDARDEDVVIVMPGTCAYVFWQIGMVQYLAEHFDTRHAKARAHRAAWSRRSQGYGVFY